MTPSIINQHETVVVLGDAAPATKSATYTSTAFDTQGYEGVLAFIQSIGTAVGTGTWDGKLTHCDTSGGSYSDVSGATFAQVSQAATAVEAIKVGVGNVKRFVKYVGTLASATSFIVSVNVAGVKKVV